jgi:hypothetical protein
MLLLDANWIVLAQDRVHWWLFMMTNERSGSINRWNALNRRIFKDRIGKLLLIFSLQWPGAVLVEQWSRYSRPCVLAVRFRCEHVRPSILPVDIWCRWVQVYATVALSGSAECWSERSITILGIHSQYPAELFRIATVWFQSQDMFVTVDHY